VRSLTILSIAILAATPCSAGIIINEIHYHPRSDEAALEWIEVANDSSTPMDISGYAFVDGISYVFPQGTILDGRGLLVVALDAAALQARLGVSALGNFSGRLDNDGERVSIANHAGIVVESVRYGDRGKWPVAADGSGHSLALRSIYLDSGEPESWGQSLQHDGSPGEPNFEADEGGADPNDRVVVDAGAPWRFKKGTAAFSTPADAWIQPAFDDGAWASGPSGFGYGDGDDATVLDDMINAYTSVAIRKRITVSAAELAAASEIYLGVDFDDGFCAFLNGVEIARENCGDPGGALPAFNALATGTREAGSETLYAVPKARWVAGENVLALVGFNLSIGSSDFSLIPRLIFRETPGGGGPAIGEETIIAAGETWKLRKGTQAFSSPSAAWLDPSFNDAAWENAAAGFGYRTVGGAVVAYEVPQGTVGNQDYTGALGMDFDVIDDVVITRLGVFDSGSDGLSLPISVRLFNRGTLAELRRLDFTPASPGELIDGSRFKDLPSPLNLSAGFQGTISAGGYGVGEPNGNQGSTPLNLVTNDGDGALAFVGGGRFGGAPDAFPDTVDGGPVNRYAAGTFTFRSSGSPEGTVEAWPGAPTFLADMADRYASIALRKRFTLTQEKIDEPGDFVLAADYDDGFCVYVNGIEALRVLCGAPGTVPVFNAAADGPREQSGEQFYVLPKESFVAGDNAICIAAYNAAASDPDFLFSPRLVKQKVLNPVGVAGGLVFNELLRGAGPAASWVEIYNPAARDVDLAGFTLTDDPDRSDPYVFPDGAAVAAGAYLVLDGAGTGLPLSLPEVRLFLLNAEGICVAAATFDRAPPAGLALGTWSELCFPDGGALEWVSATPTRGASNRVARVTSVVINEIHYNPPEDRDGEFIELYNRGGAAVDLSGFAFDNGVDYTFPAGTVIAPGGYVVVTGSPDYLQETYGIAAFGPWEGVLANRGEAVRLLDALGNPVDHVRYREDGRWSPWADGRGSSLELIDPRQDNDLGSAWEASDETDKAGWEEHRFTVADYRPAAESELHLYLVERGVCLIDDVTVRRGATQYVPNPGFETSTSPWLIGGTHVRSARTTADSHGGNACLELDSSGKGDTLVNRIEIETSPAMTAGGPYEVSLWARWQRGSSRLIVHGEYTAGPYPAHPCITCGVAAPNLGGNSLAAALRLTVPLDVGTPGAENSVRRRLRDDTGSDNLGPVIGDVAHEPPFPPAGQPVPVRARILDADGVASAAAYFRSGSAQGAFASAPLFDDGLHGDGGAGDGVYGGQLPSFTSGSRVVFYVEAVDRAGASRRFPADAPARTCLFQVQAPPVSPLDAYSLILDAQRATELQTRQLHSNDLVDGAFVFDDEKSYYNIGTRYRGSPWGRPRRGSYRVRFPRDDRFHRRQGNINLTVTGSGPNEGMALWFTSRNAAPGSPAPAADYTYVRMWLNGGSLGQKSLIEPHDGDFSEKWYGEDSEGPLLKAWGRFVFTDGGSLIGQQGWEGASLVYRGENSENYRGYYGHSMNETRDDWTPFYRLTQMLDASQTPDAIFDRDAGTIVDLDAFFRVLSVRILVGDGDAYGVNNGHNGYISYNSITGLWGICSFDLEAAFGGTFDLFSSLDQGVRRLLNRPSTRRAYLRILDHFADNYWSAARPRPFLDAVQRQVGVSTGGIAGFVSNSNARVRATVQPFLTTAFRIATNGGADIETDAASIQLEGDAPVDVETILVQRGDDDPYALEAQWTTPTRWRAVFDLPETENAYDLSGFTIDGNLAGTDSIRITNRLAPSFSVASWFPNGGPVGGGTTVTFFGAGFADGIAVSFGGAAAAAVAVLGSQAIQTVTPPAPAGRPADGVVDVVLTLADRSLTLRRAFAYQGQGGRFIRGDVNADGRTDVSDAVFVLVHLFVDGALVPPCEKSADVNDSGAIDLADASYLLDYLFRRGPRPPAPFTTCGEDATADGLSCGSFTACR
jgi:hypothetical protein